MTFFLRLQAILQQPHYPLYMYIIIFISRFLLWQECTSSRVLKVASRPRRKKLSRWKNFSIKIYFRMSRAPQTFRLRKCSYTISNCLLLFLLVKITVQERKHGNLAVEARTTPTSYVVRTSDGKNPFLTLCGFGEFIGE